MSDVNNNLSETTLIKLSAQEVGQILRRRRQQLDLTLANVTAHSTVPTVAYLCSLEAGRNNAARSKHLGSLAQALSLSEGDLAEITGRPMLSAIVDVRQASRLNTATVLADRWTADRAGAYTLDEDPAAILVVDPSECELAVGRHYAVLNHATGQIIHTVAVKANGEVHLLHGSQVIAPADVRVLGRIVHEGRAL